MSRVWWFDRPDGPEPARASETDAAAIERLTSELEQEIREYRRWRWRRRLRQLIRMLFLAAIFAAFLHRQWGAFMWMMILFGGSEVRDPRANQRRRTAGLVARMRDPRVVNVLAMARASNDPATRTVATEGLIEILPTLKASDARFITNDGMRALTAILNPSRVSDIKLMLAVLDALKQVGSPACIPAVERLLTMPLPVRQLVRITDRWYYPRLGENVRRLQIAAAECLEILRVREKQERDRNTLLRPAERPADEDMTLLRPASGAPQPDDITLVRPASDPENADGLETAVATTADAEPELRQMQRNAAEGDG